MTDNRTLLKKFRTAVATRGSSDDRAKIIDIIKTAPTTPMANRMLWAYFNRDIQGNEARRRQILRDTFREEDKEPTVGVFALWEKEDKRFEILRGLHMASYQACRRALLMCEINLDGEPEIEAVQAALTPEVLVLAAKMIKPQVILVPSLARQELVRSIDSHTGELKINHSTQLNMFHDNRSFDANDQERRGNFQYEVYIVEASSEVPLNAQVQYRRNQLKRNDQQIRALMSHYRQRGLGVLQGARAYLTLVITALSQGNPIDIASAKGGTWTALNASEAIKTGFLEGSYYIGRGDFTGPGYSDEKRITISTTNRECEDYGLRLRPAIRLI